MKKCFFSNFEILPENAFVRAPHRWAVSSKFISYNSLNF